MQREIFNSIHSTFSKVSKEGIYGKILNIATDGDGVRRRVLHDLNSSVRSKSAHSTVETKSLRFTESAR
jgi:hypothetical protein